MGPGPVRAEREPGPGGQVHRRQRAGGALGPRQRSSRGRVSLGGEVGTGKGIGARAPPPAGRFPPRCGSVLRADPGVPRWASPPPAPHPPQALVPRRPPCPCPYPESRPGRPRERRGGTGAATGRPRGAEGLRGRRAAGARSAAPPARPPRPALPAETTAVRPLRSRPPQPRLLTNLIGPQRRPVPPPAKSHWLSRKWRFVEPWRGGASSARGPRPDPPRAFAAPPAAGTRPRCLATSG